MGKAVITEQYLVDIANAIRTKNGSSASYTPAQMAGAISAIESGGTNGDVIINSNVPWSVSVTNPAHTVITSTPQAFLYSIDNTFTPRMRTVENIVTDTGYTPGRIIKSVDETSHVISVTGEPAQEIAGMVQDGWGLVYMDANGFFYSDADYSQYISDFDLRGKILVGGMQNGDVSGLSGFTIPDTVTNFKNNFITSAGDSFFHFQHAQTIEMSNLQTVSDYSFSNMADVHTLILPSLVTAGINSFNYNDSLLKMHFPELVNIGDDSLQYNNNLNFVAFKKIKAFPPRALFGCSSLSKLYLMTEDIVVPFPDAKNALPSDITVYVPMDMTSSYQSHEDWNTFNILPANHIPME